jgi:glucose-6-phosphate 1-epimerase
MQATPKTMKARSGTTNPDPGPMNSASGPTGKDSGPTGRACGPTAPFIGQTEDGRGPSVDLKRPDGDSVTILLHGAHVVSWRAAGVERLYLSPTSHFGADAAVRGGVPVVFPQFNQRGPDTSLPKHGFVRNLPWVVVEHTADQVRLRLQDDAATRARWPHAFRVELTVVLGAGRLAIDLSVTNLGETAWGFTAALHTYFAVGDVTASTVDGLAGIRLLDTVVDREGVGDARPLGFAGETDRIYWQAAAPIRLDCPNGPLSITMHGFEDAVVWNPWVDRAAALPDMPDGDWRRMLCIEAARIGRPVTLAPGATWQGGQALAVA